LKLEQKLESRTKNHLVVTEIVSLGMSMGLELNSEDVEELVEDHSAE
jgi:hypothetical protein